MIELTKYLESSVRWSKDGECYNTFYERSSTRPKVMLFPISDEKWWVIFYIIHVNSSGELEQHGFNVGAISNINEVKVLENMIDIFSNNNV